MTELERVIARAEAAAERPDANDWPVVRGFRRKTGTQAFVNDLRERDVEQPHPLFEGVREVVMEGWYGW